MPLVLVVEDGTARTDANAYASVQTFKTYADSRGLDYTTGAYSDAQISLALVNAARWIDYSFRGIFKGRKVKFNQSMQWPRYGVREDNWYVTPFTVPPNIINAQCELAFIALTGTNLFPTIAGGDDQVISQTIGPIKVDYSGGFPPVDSWPLVEKYLTGLMYGNGEVACVRG